MKKLMIATLLIAFNTAALADSVIVTDTKTWKSVPITIDDGAHTYTTVESTMPEGDYYYSYAGHRCFKEKRNIAGVDALIFHAGISGGSDIYCYPE